MDLNWLNFQPTLRKIQAIPDLNQALYTEYYRFQYYKRIREEFSAQGISTNLSLWLWVNNLVTGSYLEEPILFFSENPQKSTRIDKYLYYGLSADFLAETKVDLNEMIQKLQKTATSTGNVGKRPPTIIPDRGLQEKLLKEVGGDTPINDANILIQIYYLRSEMALRPIPLPPNYYSLLKEYSSAGDEIIQLFTSASDHNFPVFCGENPDIEQYFGSSGSIFRNRRTANLVKQGGFFEVNLLCFGPLHPPIVRYLLELASGEDTVGIFFITYECLANDYQYEEIAEQILWVDTFSSTVSMNTVPTGGVGRIPPSTEGAYGSDPTSEGNMTPNRKIMVVKTGAGSTQFKLNKEQKKNILSSLQAGKKLNLRTLPILTSFEKARAIGLRAEALGYQNAEPVIPVPDGLEDPLILAEMELEQGKMPVKIVRPDRIYDVNELKDFYRGAYRYQKIYQDLQRIREEADNNE